MSDVFTINLSKKCLGGANIIPVHSYDVVNSHWKRPEVLLSEPQAIVSSPLKEVIHCI